MKIAVLGTGNGGCATAYDWAAAGHEVHVYDFERFPDAVAAISAQGGLRAEGELEGFAPIASASHDLEATLDGAEIVFIVRPAYATAEFGHAIKDLVAEGQSFIVSPGSCGGALVFKRALGLEPEDDRVFVAEFSTLPYAVRVPEPGLVHFYLKLKTGLHLATVPGGLVHELADKIRGVYPAVEPVHHIMASVLQNGNLVIHPAVTMLNAGLVDRTGGDFLFYEEGVTESSGNLMEAIDQERMALGRSLDVDLEPYPELGLRRGYMSEATYDQGFITAPGFAGIKAPARLNSRYFNEDVGYTMVLVAELAEVMGVEVPVINSMITVISAMMNRDYRGERARSLEMLGLGGWSAEDLRTRL